LVKGLLANTKLSACAVVAKPIEVIAIAIAVTVERIFMVILFISFYLLRTGFT
jgi:hypothetical protein